MHQAGRGRDEAASQRYAELREKSRAKITPFIDDMAAALADADLVIGRAGASAVAELCAVGRPSILIPFPFAADDHQRRNAEALAEEGAAVCLTQNDASKERVLEEVVSLAKDAEKRRKMADLARKRGQPDAAKTIARDMLAAPSGGANV